MRTSILLFVCLGLSGLGLLLYLIGFSTNYWFKVQNVHQGLWKTCDIYTCYTILTGNSNVDSARAFSIIGFLTGCISVGLLCFYMFLRDNPLVVRLSALFSIVTSVCILICFSTYLALFNSQSLTYLSWSFALVIIGFLLFIANSVTLSFHVYKDCQAAYEST